MNIRGPITGLGSTIGLGMANSTAVRIRTPI